MGHGWVPAPTLHQPLLPATLQTLVHVRKTKENFTGQKVYVAPRNANVFKRPGKCASSHSLPPPFLSSQNAARILSNAATIRQVIAGLWISWHLRKKSLHLSQSPEMGFLLLADKSISNLNSTWLLALFNESMKRSNSTRFLSNTQITNIVGKYCHKKIPSV